MSELYTYQVARIRCRENSLLSAKDIETLMAAKSYDDALRVLRDLGFGEGTETSANEILEYENKKLWDFMKELLKDLGPFSVLILPTDYNNLKAAIKAGVTNVSTEGIYKDGGTIDTETLEKSVKENNFKLLPLYMREAAEKAYKILLKTGDGQVCDIIIDKNCLENIIKIGNESGDSLIKDYAELFTAISNIKIAVRCQKRKKSFAFIKDALTECESLKISDLALNAAKSEEDLMQYLSSTKYSACTEKLKEGNSAFEKWCDNKIMDLVKKQKVNPFTLGPLVAFVIARQTEMSVVKIVLSGKLNNLKDEMIRERLRDMYV